MELLQLKYFCKAAQLESFAKAASFFGVPPSNISQSIHRLETELNKELFNRSANRVHLNSNGAEFFRYVSSGLNMIELGCDRIDDNDSIFREIKLLVHTNRQIVTKAIEKFQERYLNTKFYIDFSSNSDIADYDIIISDNTYDNPDYLKELLVTDDILLAVSKKLPLAQKSYKNVNFENYRFITMSKEKGIYKITKSICNELNFEPDIAIQTDDTSYIINYVESGLGIGFIPSVSWGNLFSDNVVLKKVSNTKRHTYTYINSKKYTPVVIQKFLETLKNTAQDAKQTSYTK